jgi:hypothetical protein
MANQDSLNLQLSLHRVLFHLTFFNKSIFLLAIPADNLFNGPFRIASYFQIFFNLLTICGQRFSSSKQAIRDIEQLF